MRDNDKIYFWFIFFIVRNSHRLTIENYKKFPHERRCSHGKKFLNIGYLLFLVGFLTKIGGLLIYLTHSHPSRSGLSRRRGCKNNPFIFCNKSALSSGYFVHVGVFIPCCFPVLGSHYALHYMSLFANKKYTSWMITVQISICRMMLFHLELANITWMALTKLFQAVGSLFNSLVAIRCHCFAIERVHATHVLFM